MRGETRGDLRVVLRGRDFRRLYAVRLASQTGDGVFEVALASLFFFSPQRAATPGGIAAAFAVAILPYTLVGPFAGVLLDRWRRRDILVRVNAGRALLVVALAGLVALGAAGWGAGALVLYAVAVMRDIAGELAGAVRHLSQRRPATRALAVVGGQRFAFGLVTVTIILGDGDLPGGGHGIRAALPDR